MTDPTPNLRPVRSMLGLVLCRVIVPAWILTGAVFKLTEANPALLPKGILTDAHRLGMNLDVVLATLISIEILVALLIIFVARLARPLAIAQLAIFCAVLVREIASGNSSCGCLGTNSPSPITMLTVDGLMLLGLVFLKPGRVPKIDNARWPMVLAPVLALAGAATTYGQLMPRPAPSPPKPVPVAPAAPETVGGSAPAGATDAAWTPRVLPSGYWFESDFDAWVGRAWRDVELMQYLPAPPRDVEDGVRYVVFYGRTCDHCEEMFQRDLVPDPELAKRVTAVEVPAAKDRLTADGAWSMPDNACDHMALPLGIEWIMTTPLAIRLENGIVRCVTEGDHTECLGLPPH